MPLTTDRDGRGYAPRQTGFESDGRGAQPKRSEIRSFPDANASIPNPAGKSCPGCPRSPCQNQDPVKPCRQEVLNTASSAANLPSSPPVVVWRASRMISDFGIVSARVPLIQEGGPISALENAQPIPYSSTRHTARHLFFENLDWKQRNWIALRPNPTRARPLVGGRQSNGQQSDDVETRNRLARKHLRQEIDSPSVISKFKSLSHNNLRHESGPTGAVRCGYLPRGHSSLSPCQKRTCIHSPP